MAPCFQFSDLDIFMRMIYSNQPLFYGSRKLFFDVSSQRLLRVGTICLLMYLNTAICQVTEQKKNMHSMLHIKGYYMQKKSEKFTVILLKYHCTLILSNYACGDVVFE
tara:strand:+ start:130 stop:453 length:324 start_codon:yes stop_codon:yes gene_type:complete